MEKFALNVQTGNAAFEDCPGELARIVRAVADAVEAGEQSGICWDTNGNRVGTWST